jgi:MoaA/NifB/PqqE/SkfB family radical SAM enzyme
MMTVRRIVRIIALFNFFLLSKVFRKKMPLLASFKLTYRCNIHCRGCPFHLQACGGGVHMTWDQALHALAILKESGTRIVVFEGGEPMLWRDGARDISDLVLKAKKLFSTVAVTTNGTLPLEVPADILWVSLDGLKETQDRLRGGSFDTVFHNLKRTTHPKLFVHFTMHRENWWELEGVLKLLAEVPAVRGVTVQLFYPYGQGEAPLALLPEERRAALENAIRLKDKYPILNSTSSLRKMIDNNWSCHDEILINVDPDGRVVRGCYVKSRGRINCPDCGFTPVAEASGALDLNIGSLLAGSRVFL